MVVGAPPYQAPCSQGGDPSSLVINQNANMVVQQPHFVQSASLTQTQPTNQRPVPMGSSVVPNYAQPSLASQPHVATVQAQPINPQLPQKPVPRTVQTTEPTPKKKKPKKKNVKAAAEPFKVTGAGVMTISQPPTPPVPPQDNNSFIESSQTQMQTSQVVFIPYSFPYHL